MRGACRPLVTQPGRPRATTSAVSRRPAPFGRLWSLMKLMSRHGRVKLGQLRGQLVAHNSSLVISPAGGGCSPPGPSTARAARPVAPPPPATGRA